MFCTRCHGKKFEGVPGNEDRVVRCEGCGKLFEIKMKPIGKGTRTRLLDQLVAHAMGMPDEWNAGHERMARLRELRERRERGVA